MDVDLEELAAIVELLEGADFTDFRFDKGDVHIAVRRGGLLDDAPATAGPTTTAEAGTAAAPPNTRLAAVSAPAAPAPTNGSAASTTATPPDPAIAQDGQALVASPMLGTFYRSPKPGEPPFVQVGDTVAEDSVLCIVEVMKLMNSVRAGVAGRVVGICANDGDLVEYEQPLFVIEPAS